MPKESLDERFNASNDDHSVNNTTAELIAEYYSDVPQKSEMGEYETFYANRKAKQMLGFKEAHNWRMYLQDPRS